MDGGKRRPGPAPMLMTGPLAPYEAAVRASMTQAGYAASSVVEARRAMRRLSEWMTGNDVPVEGLTSAAVKEFLAERRNHCSNREVSRRWIAPVLRALREHGAAPIVTPVAEGPRAVLLEQFRRWLTSERSLSQQSVRCYGSQAGKFLAVLPDPLDESLAGLDGAAVTRFVVTQTRTSNSVWSAKAQVTATRALLRFLHVQGLIPESLTGAVPAVASWRLASLPRALPTEQVQALLTAHDTSNPVGMRDHALLVVLARLGLRGAEAAGLRLADVDWHAGELVVRGKAARVERLPLPNEVGAALAAYLTSARPACECATVFVTVRAPFQPLTAMAVRAIMGRACQRAGLDRVGAHRLRHSLATDLLRAGSPLAEVGQVLRQRTQLATAGYAKVDHTMLRTLAQPWPGSVR